MGHILEKFYSSFGGIDTRSNKLLMNPKTFRAGSKNFRYNFQDELQNANGFQHKDVASGFTVVDELEYKFTDPNSGEEKIQALCVGSDGNLYRRRYHRLKFGSLGTATTYSFYYDEVADAFKFVLGTYPAITVSESMTMEQLKVAINLIGAPGCSVVDEDEVMVTSTALAYFIDAAYNKPVEAGVLDTGSWFWEIVEYPSKGITGDQTPFQATLNYLNDPNYDGISYVNIYNCCLIADGGFVMKYDGKCVYRLGMPKVLKPITALQNYSGYIISASAGSGSLTTNVTYKYVYQWGFVDYNGAVTLGSYDTDSINQYLSLNPGSNTAIDHQIPNLFNSKDFPIFSCRVNGDQYIPSGGGTFNVNSGHNIKVGMLLRVPVSNGVIGLTSLPGYSFLHTRVSAVTATTITVELGVATDVINPFSNGTVTFNGISTLGSAVITSIASTAGFLAGDNVIGTGIPAGTKILHVDSSTQITLTNAVTAPSFGPWNRPKVLVNNQIINGGYAKTSLANMITTPNANNYWNPEVRFGAFLRIYRTTGDGSTFYRNVDYSISHNASQTYTDTLSDSSATDQLSRIALADSDQGEELPRVCKYLTKWQDQIVQAGRPVDLSMLATNYPGALASAVPNVWGYTDDSYPSFKYSEADLCDFQSVYWNDSLTPEGFPQDGLHEFKIATKFNDSMKGMIENKDALFAFKERSTGVLVGSLSTNDIKLEILEADVGCANHRTIKEVRGHAVWLDPINGFFSCVAGQLPNNIGFNVSDYQKINATNLDYSRAVAANFRKESLYICAVGSTTFVYDYASNGNLVRKCWYIWDRFDTKSLIATSDDQLLLSDGVRTWKMKLTNSRYDFTDHKTAISFVANTAWLTRNAPTVDKQYINFWISSVQGGFTVSVSEYGNFMDTAICTQTGISFLAESGSKKAVKESFKAATTKLSGVSFGINHAVKNEWVRIQGYEVEVSQSFDSGEPKS